ncbi:chemotaxis protein CheA [Sphingomonas sanguinis]|jgi:two-component system chemotaxis sensor kinase CheA|uniref:Chemotaxis protein CheA n=1 Tax=Sphingomonas sanguinis TaxID=33051 RepID=A0A7Y7USR9_9SPHN|nr:chemotaxis protein CheA [Sphingomonas sanguinis]MBZ6382741.1 chemotaxis protein CheA [Sphingomonas sanguinis]NNG48516.1 chemotaxis protein CheA [Sphingomonas sanguinis]NNG51752.1 chemotaxis protein CheA [Sphingomonas sanguinis]NVP32041.1 chemotaxis protein CheA [Sphingomonas sanguinis]
MNLDEIQQIFFQECEEGLGALETAFDDLRRGRHDDETINTVFRAVHSIKGGAGAFGHERLQHFSHHYETVLDLIRNGTLPLGEPLIDLIVAAFDTLSDHVAAARGEGATPADQAMLDRLGAAALGDVGGGTAEPEAAAEPVAEVQAEAAPALDDFDALFAMLEDPAPAAEEATPEWIVTVHPGPRAFDHGAEPMLALRELVRMGGRTLSADLSDLPLLDGLDAERAYIGFTMALPGDADEEDIRAVFDFADPQCRLTVTRAAVAAPAPVVAEVEAEPAPPAPVMVEEMPVAPAPVAAPAPTPPALVAVAPPPPAPAPAAAPVSVTEAASSPRVAAAAAQTIRVDLDKLDRLVNLVGELVITQAMLAQRLSESDMGSIPELSDLDHLTRELQDSTMAIRAQPMKTVFSRVPRIIRELEVETGKRVRLEVEGEMTEVDKTVVERIGEPLTHLIRNAVDHGLETPADRKAAGKDGEGVVTLSAAHQSGRIVITVADDGRGIDRARVKAKAIERGIIAPDAQLSEEEIDNLIFAPGFSTAAVVSNISGRGVGMDVVRKNIQALGGRIGIQSVLGKGSSFSLSLPLTLAVLDGMIVTVGDQTFVIPLTHIVESLRPGIDEVHVVGGQSPLLDVRGTYVPVHRVGEQLGVTGAIAKPENAVLIVVESDQGQAVLMVDSIQDQRQVVVKSLEANYRAIHGLAGATILGDGRVALILDVDALIGRWRRDGRGPSAFLEDLAA